MGLTQEQVEQFRKQYGIGQESSDTPSISSSGSADERINNLRAFIKPKQTRGQETLEDIKQTGTAIKGRFTEAADQVAEIKQGRQAGEQGVVESAFQTIGAGAGAASRSIGDFITGGVKVAFGEEGEKNIKSKIEDIVKNALKFDLPGGGDRADSIGDVVQQATASFKQLQEKDPAAARNLESIFNIGMLATDVAGVGAGANIVRKTATKGAEIAGSATRSTISTVSKVGGKVADVTSSRLPKLLGIFSGENDAVIRNALKNPELARVGIESGDVALRKAVAEGAENSIKIKTAFIKGFKEAKEEVMGKWNKVLIPKNNVKGIFNKLLKDNKVVVKNGKLDFTTSLINANPGEITKINAAFNALKKWDKFTIDSLDEYKRLVGQLTKFAAESGGSSKSPFLGRLHHEINEIIATKLPATLSKEYRALSKSFSENIDLYEDIVKAFNSGDPFTKLSGALGKNRDSLRQVLEFFEKQGGKDILPIVAGRELGLEKTAAFGFLNPRSWVDFFISPKLQGRIITNIGEKLNKGKNVPVPKVNSAKPLKKLNKTPLGTKSVSLIDEAKKFKTADEFIEAQGTPVYHGTNYEKFDPKKAVSEDGLYGKGIYFATDKNVIKQYGNKTVEAFLDENSLLKINKPLTQQQQTSLRKVMGKDEWDWSKNPTGEFVWGRLELTYKNPEALLKKAGIKGVQHEQFVTGGKNINYTIFDESAIKTKSQLTDIFNKSKGAIGTKVDDLVVEAKKFKTADEFIEAQPKVFHGTDADFTNFKSKFLGSANGTAPINKLGFSFTTDSKVAKTFGKNLIEAKIDINKPFIIDAKGQDYSVFKDILNEQLSTLNKSKYDGIIIKNYKDAGIKGEPIISDHYIPFNESQIKTKSQLTDIWNQANK